MSDITATNLSLADLNITLSFTLPDSNPTTAPLSEPEPKASTPSTPRPMNPDISRHPSLPPLKFYGAFIPAPPNPRRALHNGFTSAYWEAMGRESYEERCVRVARSTRGLHPETMVQCKSDYEGIREGHGKWRAKGEYGFTRCEWKKIVGECNGKVRSQV